jgi:hypothetical protein
MEYVRASLTLGINKDDGHILKAMQKQHYIMFPAPVAFLNEELKA